MSEFPEFAEENLKIWNANAVWWDDRIGDGNEFQTHLTEPATERLFAIYGRTGLPKPENRTPGVRWSDMTEIPPILVVRAKA